MFISDNIKSGVLAAVLLLLAGGLWAQPSRTTAMPPVAADWAEFAGANVIDSVTVGSRMAYRLGEQSVKFGLEYKWHFELPSGGTLPVLTLDGSSSFTPSHTGAADWYSWSALRPCEVSVVMPASRTNAGQHIALRANARYVVPAGIGTRAVVPPSAVVETVCSGAPSDREGRIAVINRPSIRWEGSENIIAHCLDEVSEVVIPSFVSSEVAGAKRIEVECRIEFFSSGSTTPEVIFNGWTTISEGSVQLVFDVSHFNRVGMYEITVTNITDRISRKSLDMELVKAQPSDIPQAKYQVHIYPIPDPNNIKLEHIKYIIDNR